MREWRKLYSDNCFESTTIEFPESFKSYILNEDGIFTSELLPKSSIEGWSSSEDDMESVEQSISYPAVLFPEFCTKLSAALRRFGGSCLVKIGNTAPKDSVWIIPWNSLKCDSLDEIFELLKASDRVALSLGCSHPNSNDIDTLTMIRWSDQLDPSMEFRCFVDKKRQLVAISQRDDTVFYPHLKSAMMELGLESKITSFISSLSPRPDANSVIDAYYDQKEDKFVIVDIEGWDQLNVSGILFSWDELTGGWHPHFRPLVRLIEREADCRLGYLRYNNCPSDLLNGVGAADLSYGEESRFSTF